MVKRHHISEKERRIKEIIGPGADEAYEKVLAEVQEYNRQSFLSRRGFVKLVTLSAVAAAAGVSLSSCGFVESVTGEREIVDDCGRTLTIPAKNEVEKVYFTSQLAEIFVYTLNPDLIAGITSAYTSDQLKYLPERLGHVAVMGSISGGGEIDRETLLSEDVQIVFSISGVALTAGNESDAEKLQSQTGIPVVLIDGSFEVIADAYRFLGDCIGEDDRAEIVGSYCEERHAEVVDAVSGLSEEDKISVYYAEGPEGVYTEPDTSQHALTFKVAGARNVAEVPIGGSTGMSPVNLEQILAWDPDLIVSWPTSYSGAYDDIITNPDWSNIKAVQKGHVYPMPHLPFAWCDRPPGINRLIGIQWIANMLYPKLYDVDMLEVTKEFYSMMYWVDITDDEAKEILGPSYPPPTIDKG